MVSVLILMIVLGALLMVLTVGDSANYKGTAKVDLQANVRQTIDLILRDVRNTVSYDINANAPTNSHIKFRKIEGTDANGDFIFSDEYLEYNYDPDAKKLTRSVIDSENNVLSSREINNITAPPFHTRDAGGNMIDLTEGAMSNPPRLVIIVTQEAQLRGSESIIYTLEEEVKIRNG